MNWILIRFADVLLMYAEAVNEINNGPTPEAINAFEEVRKRGFRGNTNLIGTTPTTKSGFFNAVANERFLEFGAEGMRKYDLLRWGLLNTKLTEVRANLALLRQRLAPYTNVPDSVFYRNGGSPNSVGGVDGEGLIFYTPWAPNGGSLPYWKPRTTNPTPNTTTVPGTGAITTTWIKIGWAAQLTANYADSRRLEAAVGYLFAPNKSELMPYDQAAIVSFQGKLKQNPGY
jgi:hypothetical protein